MADPAADAVDAESPERCGMTRYSLSEIDEMRGHVFSLLTSDSYLPAADRVEDALRTYMAGGVTPAELATRVADRRAEQIRRREWDDAEREIKQRLCPHYEWGEICLAACYRYHSSGDCFCGSPIGCLACKTLDRRKSSQGRPGGRRKSDRPRVPAAPALVLNFAEPPTAPKPRVRWWRR